MSRITKAFKMTDEETMHKFFKYVKEEIPSLIYAILNTAKATYKPMATNINRCAINQRNWRMYRVDLGGNGRHRNIRKAIRLMANSRHPRIDTKIADIAEFINMRTKMKTEAALNHIIGQWKCTTGPERGISHDLSWFKGYNNI